jgi:hypothetical protein
MCKYILVKFSNVNCYKNLFISSRLDTWQKITGEFMPPFVEEGSKNKKTVRSSRNTTTFRPNTCCLLCVKVRKSAAMVTHPHGLRTAPRPSWSVVALLRWYGTKGNRRIWSSPTEVATVFFIHALRSHFAECEDRKRNAGDLLHGFYVDPKTSTESSGSVITHQTCDRSRTRITEEEKTFHIKWGAHWMGRSSESSPRPHTLF